MDEGGAVTAAMVTNDQRAERGKAGVSCQQKCVTVRARLVQHWSDWCRQQLFCMDEGQNMKRTHTFDNSDIQVKLASFPTRKCV